MNRVKSNISFYLPALIDIVGDSHFDWNHIDNLFSKKIKERIIEGKGQTIIVEATIYDMIVAVKKKNKRAIGLMDFLNKLLTELSTNLTDAEKKLIKTNLRGFLTTLDKGYLNFIGEIAVLNNLIKSKTYRLENVEFKLPNKKTIDFRLRKINDDAFLLVEIVNIHLDSKRIETNEEKIKKFITDRLTQKIASKKEGLIDDINFYLVPVLWGGWKDLKMYCEYFKQNKMHLENVIEPVSYLTFTDPNNNNFYLHRFGNVSNLFNSD